MMGGVSCCERASAQNSTESGVAFNRSSLRAIKNDQTKAKLCLAASSSAEPLQSVSKC